MSLSFRGKREYPHLAESTPAREAEKEIAWTEAQDHWKLLMRRWHEKTAVQ